ncbi:MAG TPA: multidrug ABC transporter ATP-binding protein, partial [Clostridiales bacterium]|nr:multidrug ABC transporter ATP-binding protein [Clostridiales bacterium]
IFDDSFSALDYQTDKNLRKVLETDLNDTTCIIVAQRIGTIKNCDNIIVVDNGKIVGMGKHDELLQNCSVYKDIALSQLSKEELENGTTK